MKWCFQATNPLLNRSGRVPSDLDLRNDPVYGLFEMEIHEINKDRLVFPPKDGDMTRKAVLIVI